MNTTANIAKVITRAVHVACPPPQEAQVVAMSGLSQASRRHVDLTLAVLTVANSNGEEGKGERLRALSKRPSAWLFLMLGAFLFEQNRDMHRR
jgi:hypothetical protein